MANTLRARTANAPDYRVVVDGRVITPTLRGRLSSLTLTDSRGGDADQLDLVLTDDDGQLAIPPKGATIELAIGWRNEGLVDRGRYTVDEIEHTGAPDQLHIRARSANLRDSLPGKRTYSWHGITLGDIIDIIAGRHDLKPAIADQLASTFIDHIDQTDESDLNFLTRLGHRFDAIAAIKSGRLLFTPAGVARTVSGQAIPGVVFTRADGDSHRYQVTDRDSYTGVVAHWRDLKGAKKQTVVAGSKDQPKTLREVYSSQADALAAARSEWQRIQRGIKSFSVTLAKGRAALYPETPAAVVGFKPQIDATPWLITEVTHHLTDASYTNQLKFEVAGQAHSATGATENQ